jgi:hypothetical protein
MTQPKREKPEPIIGFDPSVEDALGDLSLNADEITEGGPLDDCNLTLVGVGRDPGGVEQTNNDGETYTTSEAIIFTWQIQDWEDLGMEEPTTNQRLSIPKMTKRGRANPNKHSGWGQMLNALDNLGISGNPERAHAFYFGTVRDLLGVHIHRSRIELPGFRPNEKRSALLPDDFFGFDNDVRADLGLVPAYRRGEEPSKK